MAEMACPARNGGMIMFYVIEKETGKIGMVYAINGMYFLMWDNSAGCWISDHMDRYKPIEAGR